jgi:hypothetical protein
MWQLFLRGLVLAVLRRVFVVLAAPVVFIIATPLILLRACVLSARHAQKYKFAAADGFGSVWDRLVAAFMWPFYSDMDRLEVARRQSSNQPLQPTADWRE